MARYVTAKVDMTRFDRGIEGLINQIGINGKSVVEKETGALITTLVRVTPAAAQQRIKSDITNKFHALENPERSFTMVDAAFEGKTGVNWYAWNSGGLYGIARESDMRDATSEELMALLYKTTPTGRIRGQHGKQAVYIWKKITTKAATVRALVAEKLKNRGRLKAGWLVAVRGGAIKLSGARIPDYVSRHLNGGIRGSYINGLNAPGNPRFTIINFAKGVGQKQVSKLVQIAVNIRGKAMQKNAALIFAGKKKLSQYAS